MAVGSQSTLKQQFQTMAGAVIIGSVYISLSAGLISFNKYVLDQHRFPHALQLTATHMTVTSVYSLLLYSVAPRLYPSMDTALANRTSVLKYIAPLGLMFAVALFCSNKAYMYSSVAFLQFCKEANVAIVFFMSCAVGVQIFSWKKLGILSVVIAGCALCVDGEIDFVMMGLMLQITSQLAECSKNLIGEIVMTGAGLKLDVLTFVAWQAPCSLMPLLIASLATSSADVLRDMLAHKWLLLANASVAFLLNVMIALTLKRLSALAFVIIGLLKDIVIVCASAAVFGDEISRMQRVSFGITLFGMALWANHKMQEQAEAAEAKKQDPAQEETSPLLPSKKSTDEGAAAETA